MFTLFLVIALALYGSALYLTAKRKMIKRIQALEQNLQGYLDVMTQMAEIQKKSHQKISANFEDLEERIMDLSVPSHDSNLPLERRHRVLTLARQGVALEDIVKRLKAPVGETELILNLQKYMGGDKSQASLMNEQVSPYV
jgi:hypothetical protein